MASNCGSVNCTPATAAAVRNISLEMVRGFCSSTLAHKTPGKRVGARPRLEKYPRNERRSGKAFAAGVGGILWCICTAPEGRASIAEAWESTGCGIIQLRFGEFPEGVASQRAFRIIEYKRLGPRAAWLCLYV